MKTPRIFLVGPPGAGKTTLGRRWAKRLQMPFYDTDDEILRRTGRSVEEWFAQGESAFRKAERQTIEQTITEHGWGIWAVGGGFPTQEGAMTFLRTAGYTIWIDSPSEWILARLRHSTVKRPLLHTLSDQERLTLIEKRRVYYRCADLHWRPDLVSEELLLDWLRRIVKASFVEVF